MEILLSIQSQSEENAGSFNKNQRVPVESDTDIDIEKLEDNSLLYSFELIGGKKYLFEVLTDSKLPYKLHIYFGREKLSSYENLYSRKAFSFTANQTGTYQLGLKSSEDPSSLWKLLLVSKAAQGGGICMDAETGSCMSFSKETSNEYNRGECVSDNNKNQYSYYHNCPESGRVGSCTYFAESGLRTWVYYNTLYNREAASLHCDKQSSGINIFQ